MTARLHNWRSPRLTLVVGLVLLPTLVLAAGPRSKRLKPGQFNPKHETVEMFAAIDKDQIDVKLIPKDSKLCRVLIENKTDRPLNVKLPEAFAGVPVLAQVNQNQNWNQNQGFGGGMGMGGMGGMGMGGMGGGMGMWNVPPEQVGKLKLTTVCLEHGKKEPRPGVPYEIKPIEQFTDKVAVQELCRMLGSGRISQRAAQAAAWHLNNDMSWQELAAKRIRRASGASYPYFTQQELRAALQIATVATRRAEEREKKLSPGNSLSKR